ncbi:DNA alkylation repair protein [Reichenbachiella ulvae]|uniref:DNA alkylation repair protein n=1 Tax=Reichenbachiella ulvae TaxID=2980104 RepID=A0ABT3D0B8_9BACT|nr:DNA alkylation repair protein [Reichenbachiella ulvae]MCV9389347.1 DNA alkylation repair protein [Reichenbachiella ulvae]
MSKQKQSLTVPEVMKLLEAQSNAEVREQRASKFGITANDSLGLTIKELKEIARGIEKDNELALGLFETGVYEARMLLPLLFSPKMVTPELMDQWVTQFESWEICDHFCMSFLGQTPYAYAKVSEWIDRESEFERRAGIALMIGYHFGHKKAPNSDFEAFLPLIETYAFDGRNFVKKALSWALRTIGKRNDDLTERAIACCESLLQQDHKSAHWIARDALREFSKPGFKTQRYPREVYG